MDDLTRLVGTEMASLHIYVVTTQAAHDKQVCGTQGFFLYLKLAKHYQKWCSALHLEQGSLYRQFY